MEAFAVGDGAAGGLQIAFEAAGEGGGEVGIFQHAQHAEEVAVAQQARVHVALFVGEAGVAFLARGQRLAEVGFQVAGVALGAVAVALAGVLDAPAGLGVAVGARGASGAGAPALAVLLAGEAGGAVGRALAHVDALAGERIAVLVQLAETAAAVGRDALVGLKVADVR